MIKSKVSKNLECQLLPVHGNTVMSLLDRQQHLQQLTTPTLTTAGTNTTSTGTRDAVSRGTSTSVIVLPRLGSPTVAPVSSRCGGLSQAPNTSEFSRQPMMHTQDTSTPVKVLPRLGSPTVAQVSSRDGVLSPAPNTSEFSRQPMLHNSVIVSPTLGSPTVACTSVSSPQLGPPTADTHNFSTSVYHPFHTSYLSTVSSAPLELFDTTTNNMKNNINNQSFASATLQRQPTTSSISVVLDSSVTNKTSDLSPHNPGNDGNSSPSFVLQKGQGFPDYHQVGRSSREIHCITLSPNPDSSRRARWVNRQLR